MLERCGKRVGNVWERVEMWGGREEKERKKERKKEKKKERENFLEEKSHSFLRLSFSFVTSEGEYTVFFPG